MADTSARQNLFAFQCRQDSLLSQTANEMEHTLNVGDGGVNCQAHFIAYIMIAVTRLRLPFFAAFPFPSSSSPVAATGLAVHALWIIRSILTLTEYA